VAEIVEFAATAGPAKKNAGPPVTADGVRILNVLTPATVDFIVQVEAPAAVEVEQAA
jgi:hypothetical protein